MSAKKDYCKEANFTIITQAFKEFGVDLDVSGRNDLLLDGKKVSGSAFKETKDRAFHHGTMLLNADLKCNKFLHVLY